MGVANPSQRKKVIPVSKATLASCKKSLLNDVSVSWGLSSSPNEGGWQSRLTEIDVSQARISKKQGAKFRKRNRPPKALQSTSPLSPRTAYMDPRRTTLRIKTKKIQMSLAGWKKK